MANMFSLILVIITVITGIFWLINRLRSVSTYNKNKNSSDKDELLKTEKIKNISRLSNVINTIGSLFPMLLSVLIIRSFIFEPFQIPSGSMMPTLLIGDFILVKKFSYGIKDPITQTTFIPTGHPKHGDIAVFRYPKNQKVYYIKRVIGLPGDKIFFDPHSKTLTITKGCGKNHCDITVPVTYTKIEPSMFVQTFGNFKNPSSYSNFYKLSKNESLNSSSLRLSTRQETISHNTHDILLMNGMPSQENLYYHQLGQAQSTWIVPPGQYFMMGDNRDNSADSRYWGFVPEKNLVGKVVAIWMSFEKQEGKWPTNIRLNRIGSIH